MLQALHAAEVDELKLDDRAKRELTGLDSWNEDAARRIVDMLQGTGEGAIRNKNGYAMTSDKEINAANEPDANLEREEQVAKLTEGQEDHYEEEDEAAEEYQEEDWYEEDYGEHHEEEEEEEEEHEDAEEDWREEDEDDDSWPPE